MVSYVSIYGHLAVLFWACGSRVHHGGSEQQKKPVYFMATQKLRGEAGGFPIFTSRACPQ
jgi:hypothetical protein